MIVKTGEDIVFGILADFAMETVTGRGLKDILNLYLKGMVVVPEEKMKELEALAVQGILRNSLIKDFHKEQWEHHQLKEKLERIKTLIENFPNHGEYLSDDNKRFLDSCFAEDVGNWFNKLRNAFKEAQQ